MTLIELLIGTSLFVGGTGALFLAMHQAMRYGDFLSERQVMINAVQGRLEALVATDFDTLWTDPAYAAARQFPPSAAPYGLSEVLLDLPEGRLTIQVRSADPLNPSMPSILDLHVAGCWRSYGRLIAGEDANCTGTLEAGEDANADGWVDAPVIVSTRLSRSE
ncbi:MAG: hypothetical protein HYY90_03555 [Candidatus Omnitrophica bacterium]|nr:hypothetical protein [Candidatus Omnitrophota bacterium]MBI2495039.1 hypothetical protein [Candidatus Omnitrophota bacterium]MBI3021223.1 hypothetical protein [Candidatus Omnitrophota bacterium]MBI3083417.1 hypothetical protein [Candidatus Omnitrophota bacterium]